jgi:hypothetical protein
MILKLEQELPSSAEELWHVFTCHSEGIDYIGAFWANPGVDPEDEYKFVVTERADGQFCTSGPDGDVCLTRREGESMVTLAERLLALAASQ